MLNYFPFEYVEDIYSIDYEALFKKGFRGLIFDIDNTLVPHGADGTPEVDDFFRKLHKIGYRTLLLSNNNEERIERFNRNIGTLYIAEAGKPNPACFLKAMEMLGTDKHTTLMIGDTTHTDILGANRAGIPSILVKYIGYYVKERKGIRRNLERLMLLFFPLFRKNIL